MSYFCILTEAGRAQIANALAMGRTISLTHMAVGDGGGAPIVPVETMETLVGEQYRAEINRLAIKDDDPGHVIVELVIPSSEGGWTLREAGLFDDNGDMVAIANYPETYKPTASEGGITEQTIRLHLIMTEAEAGVVQLKIDPTVVLASRDYVDESIEEHNNDPDAHPHTHVVDDVTDLLSEVHVYTAVQSYAQISLAIDAGAVTWDMRNSNALLVLTEDVTSFTMTNPIPGTTPQLTLLQDATGGWACAMDASIRWAGKVLPEPSTDGGSESLFAFPVWDDDGTPVIQGNAGLDYGVAE